MIERLRAADDEVGVGTRREHVFQRHGPRRRFVLRQHALASAAVFRLVALDAAAQAFLRARFDEHFEVELPPDLRAVQHQDAFQNEERLGHQAAGPAREAVKRLGGGSQRAVRMAEEEGFVRP